MSHTTEGTLSVVSGIFLSALVFAFPTANAERKKEEVRSVTWVDNSKSASGLLENNRKRSHIVSDKAEECLTWQRVNAGSTARGERKLPDKDQKLRISIEGLKPQQDIFPTRLDLLHPWSDRRLEPGTEEGAKEYYASVSKQLGL